MRRFFADLAFYLGMVFVVASMFIPLFKETVVRDGAAIFLFCDKQNYAQTAFNNSDSLIAQISNYSGVSEVAMTQTSGIYWVVAAEIILIIVSIVNLVVKDDSL